MTDQYLLIAGIVVFTIVLLRLTIKWHRAEAKRKSEKQMALQKAQAAAARRRKLQIGEDARSGQNASHAAPISFKQIGLSR